MLRYQYGLLLPMLAELIVVSIEAITYMLYDFLAIKSVASPKPFVMDKKRFVSGGALWMIALLTVYPLKTS